MTVYLVNWKTSKVMPFKKEVAIDFVKWHEESRFIFDYVRKAHQRHEAWLMDALVSIVEGEFANPFYYLTEKFIQINHFGFSPGDVFSTVINKVYCV